MRATHHEHKLRDAAAAIGPVGIAARVVGGATFLAAALVWRTPSWTDVVLGLVVLPAVAIGLLAAWRARRDASPLDATGSMGHVVNAAVFTPLFFLPATAGLAFLFYGASMLVAGARRSGGCEVTVIANAALGRNDQVGCVLFGPVDATEAALAQGRSARSAGACCCGRDRTEVSERSGSSALAAAVLGAGDQPDHGNAHLHTHEMAWATAAGDPTNHRPGPGTSRRSRWDDFSPTDDHW